MATTSNLPFKQDMPPRNGYPPIEYVRNLPKRGPSGLVMFIGGAAVMMYGLYNVSTGNRRMRELKKEVAEGRIAILPLLQAEKDRTHLRKLKDNFELEAYIMKDVKDWKVGESVYHNKRWVPPRPAQLEKL